MFTLGPLDQPAPALPFDEDKMKKSRKLSLAVGGAVVALVGGVWGYTTLNGATPLDASKMATVERGTMTRSST